MIVIIHGPAGSGKTCNAEAFATHYGCKRIVDEWTGEVPVGDGDLLLATSIPPVIFWKQSIRIIPIATALEELAS